MDQESRDANSLLVELDRGLQSPNIGDQSEAVVRFSNLFQRYPLPILINSACLKLAEAFKCGSNFIRIQICEVFERNQSHLNKIYNVDDFFRHLFTVTTSNDPIARSITLMTLGHIASIVSDYKSIHHYISSSLESSTGCELNATIACAACFVKQSADFACNIYPKIVSIVDSSKSSTDLMIRALSVLDHGFYNANDAMVVRSFLIDVMEKSKYQKLTCTCLTLSTKIAHTSLSHITSQIELLLKIFLSDSRPLIKSNVLGNLKFLAEKSPHIWESCHVEPLITYLEKALAGESCAQDTQVVDCVLSIFCKLLNCKCNFISQTEKNRIFQQCYNLALDDDNLSLCSMAFELLTVMSEDYLYSVSTTEDNSSKSDAIVQNTLVAVKTFLTHPTSLASGNKSKRAKLERPNASQIPNHATKSIYRNVVKLCQLNASYCPELLKLVFGKVSGKDANLSDFNSNETELICAILQFSQDSIVTPDGCWKLIKTKYSDMSETNFLNLCVLYFQATRLKSTHEIAPSLVDKIMDRGSLWFAFKVLRQAMRYGHFQFAQSICDRLHEHATTDTLDFYFKSLDQICAAEAMLLQNSGCTKETKDNLKLVLTKYENSVSPLRASIGNSRTTNFQLQFLWLRIRTLQAHASLRQCCRIYKTSPISYATLLESISSLRGGVGGGDLGLSRLGTVQQMPKIARDFRHLSECYENLSLVSFNCDNRTLYYVSLLKASCVIMADAIDAIFQYGKNLPVTSKLESNWDVQDVALEHKDLERVCNKLIGSIRDDIVRPGITASQKSIEPIISLLKSFSDDILSCHFSYPRYFFQPLQQTQIKLAITPQPSPTSNTISLFINKNLVLKVEGLIQDSSKRRVAIRKVSKVIISVTKSPANTMTDPMLNLFIQSTATARNNYFKTEFLLPLKSPGTFNVDIHVSIIDEDERLWKTGPTERLTLSVS